MTEITGTKASLIQALAQVRRDYADLMRPVVDQIAGLLRRNEVNEAIPSSAENRVLSEAGAIMQRVFVAGDGRSVFDEQNRGLSPYARMLNKHLVRVQWEVVRTHQEWLHKVLPDDLWVQLAYGEVVMEQGPTRKELELARKYLGLRIFEPNPLARYESAHTWVDPNGYRLSDRIWQVGVRSRLNLDTFLTRMIQEGRGAADIAKILERYLLPGRAKIRTTKPYPKPFSRDLAFDAMRLARTEITRAHAQAALLAAQRNPYVEAMNYNLSPQHPMPDICDGFAAGSPYPITGRVPMPVADTHPFCLCNLTPLVVRSASEVTQELRQALQDARERIFEPVNVTPVRATDFLRAMVGSELVRLVVQGVAG